MTKEKYGNDANDVQELWNDIPDLLKEGLESAPRDLCALECLANDKLFAKPDSKKTFVLWEAKYLSQVTDMDQEPDKFDKTKMVAGIQIAVIADGRKKHPCVYNLFIPVGGIVRFPFNIADATTGDSISWETILPELKTDGFEERMLKLPRWSTASRSSFVLMPENAMSLDAVDFKTIPYGERTEPKKLNIQEWNTRNEGRLYKLVGGGGYGAWSTGKEIPDSDHNNPDMIMRPGRYRLYSLKTGVNWVGSKDEKESGKNLLEHNSSLAMERSSVIQSFIIKDATFGIQTEVLTITAPTTIKVEHKPEEWVSSRDGFQVRDLSCMKMGLDYVPCQAIPYGRAAFEDDATQRDITNQKQCEFWRNAFAVTLGRAKARLFLNFGLVSISNAQNFLLGFNGTKIDQFVARDIGDAHWHDRYLEEYFDGWTDKNTNTNYSTRFGVNVLERFRKEKKDDPDEAATLELPDDGTYPGMQIMRLAANLVFGDRFREPLEKVHQWSKAQIYEFATGILDGYRDFIREALLENEELYPEPVPITDLKKEYDIFKPIGENGKYPPYGKTMLDRYKDAVTDQLKSPCDDLFRKAATVRLLGDGLKKDNFANLGTGEPIGILLNAEELLLCAGLELRLGTAPTKSLNGKNQEIARKVHELLTGQKRWPNVVAGNGADGK